MRISLTDKVEERLEAQRREDNTYKDGVAPSFTITSFRFRQTGDQQWQSLGADWVDILKPSMHIQTAVSQIFYPQ
ncbi:hypothetical protein [Psychrobacter sp. AT9]|uniref:hypothetical protein n=1 Tax=Psychrobacter sp. AT9 TaxID=3242893 RepID=UPI0039A459B4